MLSDEALRNTMINTGREIVRQVADFQTEVTRVETKYHELSTTPYKPPSLLSRLRIMAGIWWERISDLRFI